MKIGFIGLGIMGEAMSKNIQRKHIDNLYVYDRHPEKVRVLEEAGALPCKNARELAEKTDVIITMVPKSEHAKAVYEEILPVLNQNKTAIDMSTIDPEVSVEIGKSLKRAGTDFLDAPVVKSRPAAEAGTLGIYVGGDYEVFKKVRFILEYMGNQIIYLGGPGKGLIMKLCHNGLVAQIQNGVNETLTLAGRNGIALEDFVKAVSFGGGQNFYLDSKAKVLQAENYTTAFSVENMKKDLDILGVLAEKTSVSLPGFLVTHKIYEKALEKGYGKEDFSASIKVVKEEDL